MKDILDTPHASINYLLKKLKRELAYPDELWQNILEDPSPLFPSYDEIEDMSVWQAAYPDVDFYDILEPRLAEAVDWQKRTFYEKAVFVALSHKSNRPRMRFKVSLEGVPEQFFDQLQRVYAASLTQYKRSNADRVAKQALTDQEILYSHTRDTLLLPEQRRITIGDVVTFRRRLWSLWATGVFALLDPERDPELLHSYTLFMQAIDRKWGGDLFLEYIAANLIKLEEVNIDGLAFELT
jgi:hypothetical protein